MHSFFLIRRALQANINTNVRMVTSLGMNLVI